MKQNETKEIYKYIKPYDSLFHGLLNKANLPQKQREYYVIEIAGTAGNRRELVPCKLLFSVCFVIEKLSRLRGKEHRQQQNGLTKYST